MKTAELLDRVAARHGLATDYQIAKRMGWTRQRVSMYRTGKRSLDDQGVIQVADSLGLPHALVAAWVAQERTDCPPMREAWGAVAQMLERAAKTLILGLVFSAGAGLPGPAAAAVGDGPGYTLCEARRRRLRWQFARTGPVSTDCAATTLRDHFRRLAMTDSFIAFSTNHLDQYHHSV